MLKRNCLLFSVFWLRELREHLSPGSGTDIPNNQFVSLEQNDGLPVSGVDPIQSLRSKVDNLVELPGILTPQSKAEDLSDGKFQSRLNTHCLAGSSQSIPD